MEDEQIIRLLCAGDECALTELSRRYGAYCRQIASNILSDPQDVEECLNDVLVQVWSSAPDRAPQNLPAYLATVTRRVCLKRWRAQRAQKRGGGQAEAALEELSQVLPDSRTVDEQVLARELSAILRSFVGELGDPEASVFILRYWYMESVEAIASRFGFSRGKVKTILWRTRKKLKARLIREGVYNES